MSSTTVSLSLSDIFVVDVSKHLIDGSKHLQHLQHDVVDVSGLAVSRGIAPRERKRVRERGGERERAMERENVYVRARAREREKPETETKL